MFFCYIFNTNINRYEFEMVPKKENWTEKCFVSDLEVNIISECLRFAEEMESENQEASFCK